MFFISLLLFSISCEVTVYTEPQNQYVDFWSRPNPNQYFRRSAESISPQTRSLPDIVSLEVYYESLCEDCRTFMTKQMPQAYDNLGTNLHTRLFPYGKAKTLRVNNSNDYKFECQHGPAECYGNKLHACALDALPSAKQGVKYIACLMNYSNADQGSNDAAADLCGKAMSIDSESIKDCAKSTQGHKLLKSYGDHSAVVPYKSVPHVEINGVPSDGEDLMKDLPSNNLNCTYIKAVLWTICLLQAVKRCCIKTV